MQEITPEVRQFSFEPPHPFQQVLSLDFSHFRPSSH